MTSPLAKHRPLLTISCKCEWGMLGQCPSTSCPSRVGGFKSGPESGSATIWRVRTRPARAWSQQRPRRRPRRQGSSLVRPLGSSNNSSTHLASFRRGRAVKFSRLNLKKRKNSQNRANSLLLSKSAILKKLLRSKVERLRFRVLSLAESPTQKAVWTRTKGLSYLLTIF